MARVRHIPQRQCVACRQMRAKRELVRVVRTPVGEVRVDPTGKLSGRGAYVCPASACVELALRERRLEGALEVPIPEAAAGDLRAAAKHTMPVPGPL